MKKYNIELTEEQLKLLSQICDKYGRLIIGQLDHSLEDELCTALRKHSHDNQYTDEYFIERDCIKRTLDSLHTLCWNQPSNQSYGVGYSRRSDTLFDMHEVIRHQLFLDGTRERLYQNREYPPMHWNKKEPLIKITQVETKQVEQDKKSNLKIWQPEFDKYGNILGHPKDYMFSFEVYRTKKELLEDYPNCNPLEYDAEDIEGYNFVNYE